MLAHDEATNPFDNGDAVGFGIEFHLTNLTGVGEFHLLSADISYQALH